MKRLLLFVPLLVLLVGAPSRSQEKKADVRVERDLVYGKAADVELQLDLAVPKEGGGPFPLIVCLHGGGWRAGKRQDLDKTIEVLASKGFAAATVSYRLAPSAKFPAQIEDCKTAIRWLRANAKKYQLNPDRVGVMGFSAGGHLSCLVGTADKKAGFEGSGNLEQSSQVQAVVSFFGPTDFSERTWSKDLEEKVLAPFLGAAFDDKPEIYKKASPVAYVSKDAPPFLFFHGSEDKLVAPRHSETLAKKLKDAGIDAKLVLLEGEGHGWRGDKLVQTFDQMIKFFEEKLKK